MIFWKRVVADWRKKEGFKDTREEKEAAEAEREDTVWMVVRLILEALWRVSKFEASVSTRQVDEHPSSSMLFWSSHSSGDSVSPFPQ